MLLIVLKGTWTIEGNGMLQIADAQMPIQLSPLYHGKPGSSSLRYDTDIVLEKPGTDCVLIGHAWAPNTGASHVDVTFAVGPVSRQARVFGERSWMKGGMRAAAISKGAPFEKLPLTWEHAFGGSDTSRRNPADHEFCLENPVGRGMVSGRSDLDIERRLLPNIENPADLIQKPNQRPTPWGFGMIAPYWQPRAGYAGTYDESWRKHLSPLPPADLDPRFYSSAAPGLCTSNHLTGAEHVFVEGASQQGVRFQLPAIRPRVKSRCGPHENVITLQLDTLIVEPDEDRVVLVWRGYMNIHGKVHEIDTVHIEL